MKVAIFNGLEEQTRNSDIIEKILMKLENSNYDIKEIKKKLEEAGASVEVK